MRHIVKLTALAATALLWLGGCTPVPRQSADISGDNPTAEGTLPSGIVAQNGAMTLEWNSEEAAFLIQMKDGGVWGSLPPAQMGDTELGGGAKRFAQSHIQIEYIDPDTLQIKTANSYAGAFEDGRLYSQALTNGLRLIYCFDEIGIEIPVDYTLGDDYFDAVIDVADIKEADFPLLSVSLLPFCASAPNTADDYLLLPDGSGMLMSCDPAKGERTYWGAVYGTDPVRTVDIQFRNQATVRLPVFGVKKGNDALLAVITRGEGAAEINATAGNEMLGHSTAYPTFYVRGVDTVKIPDLFETISIVNKFSDKMTEQTAFSVRYFPLHPQGAQAYTAMAERYREYLTQEKGLSKTAAEPLLYYDILMADTKRNFYFGIPVDRTAPVTTFTQAEEILNKTFEETGTAPVVRLSGIQRGGLDIGRLGGGFAFEKASGGAEQMKSFMDFAEKNGVDVYPDFDVVRYRKSWGTFHLLSASKSPTTLTAYQYYYDIAGKSKDLNRSRYMLLTPAKFPAAAKRVADLLTKNSINAVSLGTLGSMAYSDYGDRELYVRGGYARQVNAVCDILKKAEIRLMTEAANDFAAVGSAHILSSPTETSLMHAQGEEIPFYQMVFKGCVPMSSQSVNLQDDPETEILKAASTGIGVLFTVCGSNVLDFKYSADTRLIAGNFDKNEGQIRKAVERLYAIHAAVQGSAIAEYTLLGDGVCQTLFENGVTVVTNFGSAPVKIGGKEIPARDFVWTAGGDVQ